MPRTIVSSDHINHNNTSNNNDSNNNSSTYHSNNDINKINTNANNDIYLNVEDLRAYVEMTIAFHLEACLGI